MFRRTWPSGYAAVGGLSIHRIEKETLDGKPAKHTEKDAFNIEYRVPVPKDGKGTLAYTVFHSY